ncbi:hypothetical protein GCM10010270_80770 [Streptomyces violaceus]|nr:hypothetical protein GCM10010270_80770 [Streptomyces janthinus]
MEYGLEWRRSHHPTPLEGAPRMHCDCDATREDLAAGIHNEPCTSREGTPDDPSEHYGQ